MGLVVGGAVAGVAVVAILVVVFTGGGSPPPPPPGPAAKPPPVSKAPPPEADKVEREMRAERERAEAARLDRFLQQIREMIKDTAHLPDRRAEVEGMLATAEKEAGPRRAEIDALRAEFARALEEARRLLEQASRLDDLLPRIREAAGDRLRLLRRRAEIEGLLADADKAAGPRKAEVDALRAECARAIDDAVRRNGLVGHWRLDGNARDSSGLGQDGKGKGQLGKIDGKIEGARTFDGKDDVIELPNSSELDRVQEDSHTLMAWYRPDEVPPDDKSDGNRYRHGILVKAGWHLGLSYDHWRHFFMDHWTIGDKNIAVCGDSKDCPPGAWYHAAGTTDRDAGVTRLYVNGVQLKEKTWPAGTAVRNYGRSIWKIGYAAPGAGNHAWPAMGAVDDVRIYSRALSAEEIRKIYEAGLAGRDP